MTRTRDRRIDVRLLALVVTTVLVAGLCGWGLARSTGPSRAETSAVAGGSDGVGVAGSGPLPSLQWRALGEPGVGGRVTDIAIDPDDPQHLLVGGDMLGVGVSTDGGATWAPSEGLTNPEVGRFTFVPSRPGEVWVGTMGGPFLSRDGGATWELRRDGMPAINQGRYTAPIDEVLVDPGDSDHLLATGGSHREWEALGQPAWGVVWESRDGGASWEELAKIERPRQAVGKPAELRLASGLNLVDGLWAADGTLHVAGLHSGVWRSDDGGRTWAASSAGLPSDVRALTAHPARPATLWAAVGSGPADGPVQPGGVWRSEDGGRTWVPSSNGLDAGASVEGSALHTARYEALAVAASDPAVLVTSNKAWGGEAVFRSTDAGLSWIQVLDDEGANRPATAYATPVGSDALAIDPGDPERFLFGNSEYVLATADAGATWTDLTSDVQPDGGLTGRGYSGLVATRVAFDPGRPASVALCGFDGANPLVSGDGGQSWRRPVEEWDKWGGCHDISPEPDGGWWAILGQAGSFNGIVRTGPDGGIDRPAVGGDLPERGAYVGGPMSIEAVPSAEGTVVLAVVGGQLHRSVDGGASWLAVDGPTAPRSTLFVEADRATPGVVYVSSDIGIWRSGDAGATFVLLGGSPSGATRLVVAGGALYAVAFREGDAGLHRMAGDGTWEVLLSDPLVADVAVDPADPSHLVAGFNDHPYHDEVASAGVRRSADGGRTWSASSEGLPLTRVATVAFDPQGGRILVGTYGRGFFEALYPPT